VINEFYETLQKDEGLKEYNIKAEITEENVIRLEGEVDTWQQVVDIGHIAGRIKGVRGVLNLIKAKDVKLEKKDRTEEINRAKEKGVIDSADVVIIGAGVSGCGIARQLSKYDLKILVVEKNSDVSEGTTKVNNGMIHAGYDSKPGSLKAKLNVRGNALYSKWAKELNFKFERTGSFVAGFDDSDDEYLNMYLERGIKNGVPGIKILSAEEARKIEPNLHPSIKKVLWTPSAGYVEPYEVTLALAENAVDNGVKFMLETEVLDIIKDGQKVDSVVTDKGIIKTKYIINAAGLYADQIAEMVDDRFYTIHPRRGTLIIFDKNNKDIVKRFIGTPPKNFTKGGGPTQTPEGNPLWGPSAKEVPDKQDLAVEEDDIEFIMNKCSHLVNGIKRNSVITFFSGLRASNYIEDFIIEISKKVEGFIHVSGIQSPGLASSPAIAERVEKLFKEICPSVKEKINYNPIRKATPCFRDCTMEQRDELIKKNPKYGHIICRCETITEAEIVNAIHGKIPATTVDAVKRRTRAGMGRCQGGFCGPRVVEILARELNISPTEVTQKGKGSRILMCSSR
jgi:glycerol-3-phosphate dehydrogenase